MNWLVVFCAISCGHAQQGRQPVPALIAAKLPAAPSDFPAADAAEKSSSADIKGPPIVPTRDYVPSALRSDIYHRGRPEEFASAPRSQVNSRLSSSPRRNYDDDWSDRMSYNRDSENSRNYIAPEEGNFASRSHAGNSNRAENTNYGHGTDANQPNSRSTYTSNADQNSRSTYGSGDSSYGQYYEPMEARSSYPTNTNQNSRLSYGPNAEHNSRATYGSSFPAETSRAKPYEAEQTLVRGSSPTSVRGSSPSLSSGYSSATPLSRSASYGDDFQRGGSYDNNYQNQLKDYSSAHNYHPSSEYDNIGYDNGDASSRAGWGGSPSTSNNYLNGGHTNSGHTNNGHTNSGHTSNAWPNLGSNGAGFLDAIPQSMPAYGQWQQPPVPWNYPRRLSEDREEIAWLLQQMLHNGEASFRIV